MWLIWLGTFFDGKTIYINASSCTFEYRPTNKPIIFHLPFDRSFAATCLSYDKDATSSELWGRQNHHEWWWWWEAKNESWYNSSIRILHVVTLYLLIKSNNNVLIKVGGGLLYIIIWVIIMWLLYFLMRVFGVLVLLPTTNFLP